MAFPPTTIRNATTVPGPRPARRWKNRNAAKTKSAQRKAVQEPEKGASPAVTDSKDNADGKEEPRIDESFVMFDVIYQSGARSSHGKVPASN